MNVPPRSEWVPLDIPPSALLFRRVSFRYFDGTNFTPAAVGLNGNDWDQPKPGLSVNWKDCSSVEETRKNKQYDPRYFGVLTLAAGCAEDIEGRNVVHTPDLEEDNYSHSEIRALIENREKEKTIDIHLLLECCAHHPKIEPDARLFLPLPNNLYQTIHDATTTNDLIKYMDAGVRCYNQKEDASELVAGNPAAENQVWLLEIRLTKISRGTIFSVKHDENDTARRYPILRIAKLRGDTFSACLLSEEVLL